MASGHLGQLEFVCNSVHKRRLAVQRYVTRQPTNEPTPRFAVDRFEQGGKRERCISGESAAARNRSTLARRIL